MSSSSPTVDGRLLLPYIRPSRRRCPSEGGANTSFPLTGVGVGAGGSHRRWRWRSELALALTTGRATGVTGATRGGRNGHDGKSTGRRRDGTGRRIELDRAERDGHDGTGPVFSTIQAHLKHIDFKLQHGDIEGALTNVADIETLINKRFEVLLVADEAGFEVADCFQLYQSKSVLTLRSYKSAVADVAALKRARTGYTRGARMPTRDGDTDGKSMPPTSCHETRFKGVCFRCGQPGHMANACPTGGRGAQGPSPVV
ncbi:unnamed protein product [Closterium sp. NIES-54]